jgi:DNA-binding transcriptional LysR family regulator
LDNLSIAQIENFRLKVFRAVAAHLNFHKAAGAFFLTQLAVTLQIKALENDLGVRLLHRAFGRISLTRQRSALLTYASKIAALAEVEQELGCNEGKVSRDLPLGVSTTIAQYVLP